MDLQIFQVDAFTTQLFAGNPAAVVPLAEWIDAALMQQIAAENNLSETAFFVPVGTVGNHWHIRWFTPDVEVPLCGHATLASAAVIRSEFSPSSWPITLDSASGPLTINVDGDEFVLDFPANEALSVDMPDGLQEALGAEAEECLSAGGFYLIALPDEMAVRSLSPDFSKILSITEDSIIVTAGGESVDFVSRFFGPGVGIDEDPVTGAAHCVLTPYWSKRLGKSQLTARQISQRGGELGCELRDDRVLLRGRAVFYLKGELTI